MSNYFTEIQNEVDIPIHIGNVYLTVRLDCGFFSPVDRTYAGLHNHSTYEIYLFLEGSHKIFVHDQFYTVEAGDICFLSPGVYHYYVEIPAKPEQICTFKLIIPDLPAIKNEQDREEIDSLEARRIITALTDKKFSVFRDKFASIDLIPEILQELSEKPVGFYSSVKALFMKIIINFARSVSQSQRPDYTIQKRLSEELRNEVIDGFFYYNYSKHITADDLVNLITVSRRQLHRILKVLYNLSFREKLLETRIEKAKDLLLNSDMTVDSIAEKVGYLIPANFYSIFKKTTGMSPGSYRKIMRDGNHDSAKIPF